MTATKATWTRHVGDVNDTIQVEVSAALGDTLDAVTLVEAVLRHRVTGAEVTLAAAVTDSTERVVTVTLGAWLASTAVAGDEHLVSLAITASGIGPVTFPERLEKRLTLAIV
jgi:hypothetical protein